MLPPVRREGPLQVQRRQDLPIDHRLLEVRRIFIKDVETTIREPILNLVPIALFQLVRGILNEHRHQMFARRRDGRIDHRSHGAFQHGIGGRPAILGVVVSVFDIVLIRANVDGAAMLRTRLEPGTCLEIRHLRQGHIDLQRGAIVVNVLNGFRELRRQNFRIEQF